MTLLLAKFVVIAAGAVTPLRLQEQSSRGTFLTGGSATGTGENDVPAQIIAAEPTSSS